jgi:hypothetical protein
LPSKSVVFLVVSNFELHPRIRSSLGSGFDYDTRRQQLFGRHCPLIALRCSPRICPLSTVARQKSYDGQTMTLRELP